MTKRAKIFVWTMIIFVSLLMLVTMYAMGIKMTYYVASRWNPAAQDEAIWRSTDGTIVLDFHDDEVSGDMIADGYIISDGKKIDIKVSIFHFNYDMFIEGDSEDNDNNVVFKCRFKNKNKFIATVDEVYSEKFDFLKKGDKFVFIKDQE